MIQSCYLPLPKANRYPLTSHVDTQVQVAPNNTDDSTLLAQALANLKARTGVETLFTDGGYGSSENDSCWQSIRSL